MSQVILIDTTAGISAEEFHETNMRHHANMLATVRLLIGAGAFTEQQFHQAQTRALADIDQAFAAAREEYVRQLAGLPPLGEVTDG
jgi:hypothetical protein